jgi:hypothetical protein
MGKLLNEILFVHGRVRGVVIAAASLLGEVGRGQYPRARLLTDRGVSSLIFACCESAIGG